ncbi:hypothetical protein GCM10027566_15140 [Arachidicoccus ginsenosidivorans]|jgi:transcriptional regulator with XRE-family HTH domain|uniref:Helix-turn-helix transcriptional regulator n=1 Tax=Arachidicoccus ginsenosidivorans TaxID=496057 RepID=A0A5B8VK56_9BACT|nr:helix-turn-helix transcriptional regulator [Arachidicoccus ginsenosidivorans]QEC71006.1 helix-turn-helix transcriptional regulator [Arachidicoccus ginsenosidivorans]
MKTIQHQGSIIKRLRENFGYSQEAIAAFLGVKKELVNCYEAASEVLAEKSIEEPLEISLDILEKLADLFGVDVAIFYTDNIDTALSESVCPVSDIPHKVVDLKAIAAFNRIIKNYQRIVLLEKNNA